jgi:NADH-quinone oxidoreductase subunit M
MAFIIGYWGSSDKRWFASRQFLLYSLVASVPMLMAVVYVYSVFGTCDIIFLKLYASSLLSPLEQVLIWLAIFVMLAAKIPMFPLHS